MCGIVYVENRNGAAASKEVRRRYDTQKERGTDGYGFVAIKNGRIVAERRATTEREIMRSLKRENAPIILFHHRNPTSTPNIEESTHPLWVAHRSFRFRYLVAHNGVLSNSKELQKEHAAKGYKYKTKIEYYQKTSRGMFHIEEEDEWNDSESFAFDLAEYLEGKKEKIESRGSIAFVALKVAKNSNRVYETIYGRNSENPLIEIEKDGGGVSVVSEDPHYWRNDRARYLRENYIIRRNLETGEGEEGFVNIGETFRGYGFGYGRGFFVGARRNEKRKTC